MRSQIFTDLLKLVLGIVVIAVFVILVFGGT